MSYSTLRRIRRLTIEAAPVVAELERRHREWEQSRTYKAEEHLLRIITVFRYGEPRIDEALGIAYRRALSKLKTTDALAPCEMRSLLRRESPDGDIKISASIQQLPDWLVDFCFGQASMNFLELKHPPRTGLRSVKPDLGAWPFLPQGVPEPCADLSDQPNPFTSAEESKYYLEIHWKPKDEWTRHEHRFMREIDRRGRMVTRIYQTDI